jgi:hypothetical protein
MACSTCDEKTNKGILAHSARLIEWRHPLRANVRQSPIHNWNGRKWQWHIAYTLKRMYGCVFVFVLEFMLVVLLPVLPQVWMLRASTLKDYSCWYPKYFPALVLIAREGTPNNASRVS